MNREIEVITHLQSEGKRGKTMSKMPGVGVGVIITKGKFVLLHQASLKIGRAHV